MTIEFTHEQGTKLSDLIRAAEECREKGELYERGEQSIVMLPYGTWRRLCAASQSWQEEKEKKTP